MKILWAPWRSEYIENIGKSEECFLCEAYRQPEEKLREYLVLYRTEKAFIILNKYPYNTGHIMVCPASHLGDYRLRSLTYSTPMVRRHKLYACLR